MSIIIIILCRAVHNSGTYYTDRLPVKLSLQIYIYKYKHILCTLIIDSNYVECR